MYVCIYITFRSLLILISPEMECYRTVQFRGSSRNLAYIVIVNENCFWFDQNSNCPRVFLYINEYRAQIHAYRGELISLLAPYDNYDAIGPRISSNRSCDGIVGTPITLTFLLLTILIFFSLSPSSFFSFFLSLYFDSIRSTFFLRLSSFHGIIIIHNFCPVNGNTIRKNQFKNEETKIATARMRCNIFFDS